jgi:hypothetical protein
MKNTDVVYLRFVQQPPDPILEPAVTRCLGILFTNFVPQHVLRSNTCPHMYRHDFVLKGLLVLQHLLDQGCDPNVYHGLEST